MAQQTALGFLESQIAHIEREAYAIRYPEIQYPQLVPISTEAPAWARTITHYSTDQYGEAEWFAAAAQDMPLADVTRDQHNVNVEMFGIGYGYNSEELGQAMLVPGTNLSADRAGAARRAAEEKLDDIVLNGDSEQGWDGLMNHSSVTKSDAPATGTSSSTEWKNKTPDQIIAEINALLSGIYVDTKQVEMANTLLVPVKVYTDLASRRLTDSNGMTLLEYIMKSNVFRASTGGNLMIRTVRGLENAAAGNKGRAIAYRRDPMILKFHLPMPHRFLDVYRTGPMTYIVPGIMRTAGLEIRRPKAIRYLDLITD